MILGSGIGSIITPFAQAFAWVLAAYYSFTHNYGWAIVLLTLTVMIVVFPLTRRGTRSMMRMQLLAPELKTIRDKYKKTPGQTAQERQESQRQLNEEMMALYRENGVSPTGGCLPTFLQFPIFIVLYDVIRGMTRTKTVNGHVVPTPQYVPKHTALYNSLIHDGGKMYAFGLNLADSVRTHQPHWYDVIPYVIVVLIAVALQYVSIWQITNRNPAAAQANPQMQAVQKFMPLIFVVIYIVIPAGVGIYFIVSSAFRICQQEYMYKHDKHIVEAVAQIRKRKADEPLTTESSGGKKGFFAQLRELSGGASAPALESGKVAKASGSGGSGGATGSGGSGGSGGGQSTTSGGGSGGSGAAKASNGRASSGQKPQQRTQQKSQGKSQQSKGSSNGSASDDGAPTKPPPARSNSKRPRRPR